MRPIDSFILRARSAAIVVAAGLLIAGCPRTVPRLEYTPLSGTPSLGLASLQPLKIFLGAVKDSRGVEERFLVKHGGGDIFYLEAPLAVDVKEALNAEFRRMGIPLVASSPQAQGRLDAEITRLDLDFPGFFSFPELIKARIYLRVTLQATGQAIPLWEVRLEGSGRASRSALQGPELPLADAVSRALSKAVARLGQTPGFADTLAKLSGSARAVAKRETPLRRPEVVARPAPPETKEWRSAGSGFLLRATTHVLTSLHVVQGMKAIRVSFPTGEIYPAKVVAGDANNDLALLQVQGMQARAGGFVPDFRTEVEPGERVHALGYPLGTQLSRQPSIVSGEVSATTGLADNIAQFRMTTPINEGNSGGPVINSRGFLVGVAASGMIQRGIEGIRFGTKISAAMLILQRARLAQKFSIEVVPKGRVALTPVEIFRKYSPFVVLIETQ